MTLKIWKNIYTLEKTNTNINKFIDLTIWGVTPKYKKWYEAFRETPEGQEHFKRLNNLK